MLSYGDSERSRIPDQYRASLLLHYCTYHTTTYVPDTYTTRPSTPRDCARHRPAHRDANYTTHAMLGCQLDRTSNAGYIQRGSPVRSFASRVRQQQLRTQQILPLPRHAMGTARLSAATMRDAAARLDGSAPELMNPASHESSCPGSTASQASSRAAADATQSLSRARSDAGTGGG